MASVLPRRYFNHTQWQKTGRRRHRIDRHLCGFRIVMALQLEESRLEWFAPMSGPLDPPEGARVATRWRDALPNDLLPIEG